MKIDVISPDMDLTETIVKHAQDRLFAALDQYQGRIGSVEVKLGDVNGPRGGEDKTCDVAVQLFPKETIFVKEQGDDLYLTISKAADRTKNAVGRKVERLKEHHE